jgi:hypothetical protein
MPDSQPSASSIITLTSDFGTQDQYVSAMKAVILGLHPRATLVDVSHDIPPQDIMAAAWILKNTAFLYPSGTVHLAVVDPGVGTQRKPIALRILLVPITAFFLLSLIMNRLRLSHLIINRFGTNSAQTLFTVVIFLHR